MTAIELPAPLCAGGVTISPAGIRIDAMLNQESFIGLLRSLVATREYFHLGLADLINYGAKTFGEEPTAAMLEQLHFDLSDVARAKHIRRVPWATRDLHRLTSEHYYVLGMQLPEDEEAQEMWARRAAKESLSAYELKKSIATGRIFKSNASPDNNGRASGGIITIQVVKFQFDRWEKQVGGHDSILKWDDARKQEFLKNTKRIADLRAEVAQSLKGGS